MSTFYLLPPRPLLAERLKEFLESLLPGLDLGAQQSSVLADLLEGAVRHRPDVFVACREELPTGESTALALANAFGAEPGDEVIEVRPGSGPGGWTARRWRLADAA